jgi:ankyrin repeat protein
MSQFLDYLKNHEFDKAQMMINEGFDINSKITFQNENSFDTVPIITLFVVDGNEKAVEFLIQQGVDIYNMDNDEFCPLFYAASAESLNIFTLLLDKGFDLTAETFSQKVVIQILKEKNKLELIYDKFENIKDWSLIENDIQEEIKVGFEKLNLETQIKASKTSISHKKKL